MDLKFVDVRGLSDDDKNKLLAILKSDTLKLPCDVIENNANSVTEVSEVSELQHWYNAMTPTNVNTFPQPLMAQLCNEWPMYNVSTNGHMQPYMPGVFSCPGYPKLHNVGTEIQFGTENECHNSRDKNLKRGHYNGTFSPINDMQSGYTGDQTQFSQIPIMYIYPDHSISTQQHQVPAGQIYYSPPMYSSIPHPHPNAQPISSNAQTHPTYSPNHQLPPMNSCVRQSSAPLQQPNQEFVKQPIIKSHEKPIQDAYIPDKPISQQVNENNSSQVAVVVAVNNSTSKSPVKNVVESTANIKNVVSSEKIDAKIQNNTSLTANENCNGTEKVEMTHVSNGAEANQNGKIDKKLKNEIESNTTTDVKTLSKPTLNKVEKSKLSTKVQINGAPKDTQNNIAKTPNGSPSTSNDSTATPKTLSPVSTVSPPATKAVRSYASLFRKNSIESQTTPLSKPVQVAEQNGSPKTPIQKEPTSPNFTPENQNDSPSTQTTENDYKILQNGVLHTYYDDPNAVRMGEFLSNYQMDKQTVSLLPRGLTNRSNYCYINSILQALLACPSFYNLLKALPLPKDRNSKSSPTPLIDSMVRFVHEFTPLAEAARMPRKDRKDHNKRGEDTALDIYSGVAFEPSYIYETLKNTSAAGAFSVEGRQEDAEECLSCLLNGINDEMLELMKLVPNDQNADTNANNNINNDHDEEEWQVMGPKNKGAITRCTQFGRTPLSDIFRGQLRSRISRAGEQPTDNVQPFFTLQLDVQKAESVKSALDILVGKDQVEGMTCSKTRQQIEAWKQVTLEELPVILIMHLKWFVYKFDKYSNGCSKILKSMEFPVDLKIDGKFLSPNTAKKLSPKQKQYKLFAVTYHDGKEATKGHYITDAFHVGYGSWVRYDDSTVRSVTESNVLRPTSPRVPYLLYYRRCDTIGNNQTK
ncbi:ubiquitin carboxyl-terminal hydrolase 10 [Linepithema humile]|uniref:ubiquitin carboxyl-terminal hydrolase 10 n=1 Tax=Linepithema humile TaxID=83485 RepID=UPI0006233715|nr:PREDICTED: ubiquitin carboxyl-terminal hydrolase 10 [Linepithema humile]